MIIDKRIENKSYVNHRVNTLQFSNLQVINCHVDSTTTQADIIKLFMQDSKIWRLSVLGGEVLDAQIEKTIFLESSFPDVRNSTFRGCDFQNNIWQNQVTNCSFKYCSFERESFNSARFQGCTFTNCTFYDCTNDFSLLSNCIFKNCKLQANYWGSSQLTKCQFIECTISNDDFRETITQSLDFTSTRLLRCFVGEQFKEVSMYEVELYGLKLEESPPLDFVAELSKAYFSNIQNHNAQFLRILSLVFELVNYRLNSGALVYMLPESLFNKLWNPKEFHTELYKYHPNK